MEEVGKVGRGEVSKDVAFVPDVGFAFEDRKLGAYSNCIGAIQAVHICRKSHVAVGIRVFVVTAVGAAFVALFVLCISRSRAFCHNVATDDAGSRVELSGLYQLTQIIFDLLQPGCELNDACFGVSFAAGCLLLVTQTCRSA